MKSIISYQVNLSREVSAMFNSLMPSLNSRSLPFVVFLGGFLSRCQNLSSRSIRPGGLLFIHTFQPFRVEYLFQPFYYGQYTSGGSLPYMSKVSMCRGKDPLFYLTLAKDAAFFELCPHIRTPPPPLSVCVHTEDHPLLFCQNTHPPVDHVDK